MDSLLRDWLLCASGLFGDVSVGFADDLTRAPLSEAHRGRMLPDGEWAMLEKDGEPFVLAGIKRGAMAGRECFTILECDRAGSTRISFWEHLGPTQWRLFRDKSFVPE